MLLIVLIRRMIQENQPKAYLLAVLKVMKGSTAIRLSQADSDILLLMLVVHTQKKVSFTIRSYRCENASLPIYWMKRRYTISLDNNESSRIYITYRVKDPYLHALPQYFFSWERCWTLLSTSFLYNREIKPKSHLSLFYNLRKLTLYTVSCIPFIYQTLCSYFRA